MKTCASCTKEIPESALHCVFCGAKQPPSGPPPGMPGVPQMNVPQPVAPQKTIMGYAAVTSELLKGARVPGPGAPGAPAAAAAPPPPAAAPMGAPPAAPPPMGAAPPMAPPPPMAAPPPAAAPPFGVAPPVAAPPPPMAAPPMAAPPMAAPPWGQPPGMPPGMAPPGMAPPGMAPPGMAPPMAAPGVAPGMATPRPQFLASETAARAISPIEPWAGSLRALMIVFGALLVAIFVAPWLTSPEARFSWDFISDMGDRDKTLLQIWPIGLAAGGVLALLLGSLPVGTAIRGAGATFAGLTVVTISTLAIGDGEIGDALGWRAFTLVAAPFLGAAGLLLRAKYPGALSARLLATVGAAALLATFLVPIDVDGESMLPLSVMLEFLDEAEGVETLAPMALLVVFATGVLMLLAWLPAQVAPAPTLLAWLALVAVPLLWLAFALAARGDEVDFERFAEQPWVTVYPVLEFLAGLALAAYGLATLVGKAEERPAA